MTDRHESRLTLLLRRSRDGDAEAEAEVFQLVFDDLRDIARGLLRGERPNHTLPPTALVGDAWLRLSDAALDWDDRTHFFRLASRAMRRALVDHARARRAQKRGGAAERVPLDELVEAWSAQPYDLIDLDDALGELAEQDPQLVQIVELRFFGGMTLEETGQAVGMSFQQVHRAWNVARGWLHRRLTDRGGEGN